MSIVYNAFTFNGKSTSDFPFNVFVEVNDGLRKPKRKNNIIRNQHIPGAIVNESEEYETVEKTYTLYIHGAELEDLHEFLTWLDGKGKLITTDNPNHYYEVLEVYPFEAQLDEWDGYEIEVTFLCNPFSYELEEPVLAFIKNGTITNRTGLIMYPKIVVYGNSTQEERLTIGDQTIAFKNVDGKLTIECKHGLQNVFNKNGYMANGVMRGPFFRIKNGIQGVVFSSGISKVEIYCRWRCRI